MLIVITLGTCLIGIAVVQVPATNPGAAGDFTSWMDIVRLNRIFTSPWFFLTALGFLLSLGYSLIGQFNRAKHAFSRAESAHAAVPVELVVPITPAVMDEEGNTAGALPARLRAHLRRQGFHPAGTAGDKQEIFLFRKNRWGVWGAFVFHTGLFLLVLAAFFTYALEKRGFIQLIEGDTFFGRTNDFLSVANGPWARDFAPGFQLHLKKFRHAYWDTGDLKELRSDVVIYDDAGGNHAVIDKGTPATVGAVKIYQSGYYGYTVKVSLMEGDQEAVPSYFSLDMPGKGKALVGESDFPMTDYICKFTFIPDSRGKSPYPISPLLQIRFFREGREIQSAVLSPGEDIVVEGHRFLFTEVRSWSGFSLCENKALPLVYLGFVISTGGIFMLYGLIPQTILLTLTPTPDGGCFVAAALACRRGKKLLLAELQETMNRMVTWKI